ncbi:MULTISPECIES: Kelch repeat-containing protein [Saccharibacillus]|uniref:Kelch repeat-containing protein n=1 Tax=Saccharibacillus TaxID=456492 RepID=UPI0013118724|nr:kelch repeat-containing protein [Saccharibacillus sp. WB 17]MWJ30309.1 kelch-like protein [Saccharibacillus sp. WB 17]
MKKSLKVLLGIFLAFLVLMPSTMQAAEEGWVSKANLLKVKDRMNLVTVNGKIYAIGGMSGNTYLNTVDEYNPESNEWITKTTIPTSFKASASSAVINGKIYIAGGYTGNNISKTMEIYDPAKNEWTRGADLPVTVAGHSTQVVDGKIILLGGFTIINNAVTSTYEYDPTTNVWSTKANMTQGRRYTSSAVVNGKIYAVGGFHDSNGILSSVEEYDPKTNIWTKKASLPKGKSSIATTSFNGLIYAIGGSTATASVSGPATTAVDIYNPQTDTWTTGPALKVAKHSIAATVLNNKIYIAGGSNNSAYYNNFEILDLTSTLPPVIEEPTTPPGTGEPTTPPGTGEPATPPGTGEPTTPPGTGEPTIPGGDRAILVITMNNGLEKEYDLSMAEVNAFTAWYDAKDAGKGSARFVIDKHSNNKGPFSKRTDSVIFNNILTFEVSEYTLNQPK